MSLFTELAASPVTSTIAGAVGGLVSSVLGFFQKKEDNKFQLTKMDKDRELAIVMANIEETKQAGMLAALREKGAGEAFTASVEADGRLKGGYKVIEAFRAATRPGLTWLYQAAFLLIFALSLIAWWRKWCDANQIEPFIEYMVIACINNANLCLTWWFGQRASDKMTLSWGNKTSGASVASK